jgi:hypothetical protein
MLGRLTDAQIDDLLRTAAVGRIGSVGVPAVGNP